jgi:hypothetical protein
MVALLRAIGNMLSGFAGALLLGTNAHGFLLGLGICVMFNTVVSMLTDKDFAATVIRIILYVLKYFGALILVALAIQIPVILLVGFYWLAKSPWGEVFVVSLVFIAVIIMIVVASKPTSKK